MAEPAVPAPDPPPGPADGGGGSRKKTLVRDVLIYSAARLGLVVVITGVIIGVSTLLGARVPLVLALLIAVVAALPLSMVVFQGLRRRVNQGIVVVDAQRRAEREDLQARLSGTGDG